MVHSIPRIQPCNGLSRKKFYFPTRTLHQRTATSPPWKILHSLSEMDLKWGGGGMEGSLLVQFRPPHSPSLWLFPTGWKWERWLGLIEKLILFSGANPRLSRGKEKKIIKDSWDKDIGCVGNNRNPRWIRELSAISRKDSDGTRWNFSSFLGVRRNL